MLNEVCKFANVLKSKGVQKGDRVSIYMPMIPELAIAMLACARIGAVHSIVFGGFSSESLRDRINDSNCKVLITADGNHRGGKPVNLKINADMALEKGGPVESVIVVRRSGAEVEMEAGRDFWYHEEMAKASLFCEPTWMEAEDPLFILYTSGSTGKPKGVLHTTAGYLMFAAMTHKYIFDVHEEDTYWCTADIGWITGHSYIVYGPLCNGTTTLMFEGIPTYPQPDRFWQIVEKFKVSTFYTAPTAIRSLMREGEKWPKSRDLSLAPPARLGGRTDQSRGVDVVPPQHRTGKVPHRRYLVADRDRRHPDHPAAGSDADQARLGHQAVLRNRAGHLQGGWKRGGGERRRIPGHQETVARHHEDGLWSA